MEGRFSSGGNWRVILGVCIAAHGPNSRASLACAQNLSRRPEFRERLSPRLNSRSYSWLHSVKTVQICTFAFLRSGAGDLTDKCELGKYYRVMTDRYCSAPRGCRSTERSLIARMLNVTKVTAKVIAERTAYSVSSVSRTFRPNGSIDPEKRQALEGRHRWSRVETKMHCVKLLGPRLMARDFVRQVPKPQIHIAVRDGYTALGIPGTETVG